MSVLFFAWIHSSASVEAAVRVFPGAVGFGTTTRAGRGGKIWKVRNLNDSGPGSLRRAIEASGRRTIIFEVSGTIILKSGLRIRNPFITIAGQTAPSPGITLRGAELSIDTHDVLIQHIRVRVGDRLSSGMNPESLDGLSIEGKDSYNIVVDHVSVSWAIDEAMTSWNKSIRQVTFSNCIVSEALYDSLHPKGPHSMGALISPNARSVSFIGNLLAHNADRNPLISTGSSTVVANNLFYNWMGGRATNIGNTSSSFSVKYATLASIVGNVYIKGPNTTRSSYAISTNSALNRGSKIFHLNNRVYGLKGVFRNKASFNPLVRTRPIWISGFRVKPSSVVKSSVLSFAGARPMDRDTVDRRVVYSVRMGSGRIVNSQSDVGSWPHLPLNRRYIPIPANANGDDDRDGYTNFEEHVLFPMAARIEGRL